MEGTFEYEQPRLLFSQEKISLTLKAGEPYHGELYIGTEENREIYGYVSSSSRRLILSVEEFSGTTVCIPYDVDTRGLQPGESFQGALCFTTSIGEYRFSFEVRTPRKEVRSTSGEVVSLEAFRDVARDNFREAYRIFTDSSFFGILKDAATTEKAVYLGMSRQPVTYQHVEEFLIGMHLKDAVRLSLKTPGASYYDMKETIQESFVVQRSCWGHMRFEIETVGDFLEVNRHVVTEDDFIGSCYQVDYIVHRELLGKGNQFGEIVIRSPYQELHYHVTASLGSKLNGNRSLLEKRTKIALMQDYLSCSMGKTTRDTWISDSMDRLEKLFQEGCDYPEYQVYEAYLLFVSDRVEEAKEILKKYQNRVFTREELEFAGIYLYLCNITRLYKDRSLTLKKIQNFYMQKSDSVILFWILSRLDPAVYTSSSNAVFMMEELFEKGCRSPLLYQLAWETVTREISVLHRLNRFWVQVFLYAGKNGLLTEELSMRFAYLSGYEKGFSESTYRALAMICDAFPSDDTVEGICKYIMKGNPRRPEYFRWYAQAVDRGLRLTRLFEYYVETMDTSYHRELPKSLLMYFTYNNDSLGDARRAYIYACVIANKEHDPQTYETYYDHMKAFARQKLAEGRMDEDYAVCYQEFFSHPGNREEAQRTTACLFTRRVYCDAPKIRYVVVRHSQMKEEAVYPCVQGVAYPRIYTEDAAILFQDEKQRRYVQTVDYNIKKMMEDQPAGEQVALLGTEDPGVLLNYCETNPISAENLSVFQQLVRQDAFTDSYKETIRKKILEYYSLHEKGEDLERHLDQLDYREYARVDKKAVLDILISSGRIPQAYEVIRTYGTENVQPSDLLKVVSRMIMLEEGEEDPQLTVLAQEVYQSGIYDELILRRLTDCKRLGVDQMISLWKSQKGFGMDTYDVEEQVLKLLMLTGDYRKEGEAVFEDYVRHFGREDLMAAFLTHTSYGIFVKEYALSPFIRTMLERAYQENWPVDKICRLTLLKALSREKNPDAQTLQMEETLLGECTAQSMMFSFFRKLPRTLLEPCQLDDKTFVECHADPGAKVTLHYALDTGLGLEKEYRVEPMRNVYEGIFVKTFTLFYGESLHYYFRIEENGKTRKTSERVISMNKVDSTAGSKYQMLNQILCARKLEKDSEVIKKLRQYLRQERYVKEMFVMNVEE